MPESTETLHEGEWLRLRRTGRWEFVERTHGTAGGSKPAVVVLATTPDDRVLLVEQHRVPVDARTIEFPAGLVGDEDAGEDAATAAARELEEETGWRAATIEHVVGGPTSAGLTSEQVVFVRATGLEHVGPGGGVGNERITVHAVPRAAVAAWLLDRRDDGCLLDAKLWSGLWLLAHDLDGSPRP